MYDEFRLEQKFAFELVPRILDPGRTVFKYTIDQSPNLCAVQLRRRAVLLDRSVCTRVTVDKATYRMWAADGGIKWNGLAVNGQYFMRWLNDFEADGPLPLAFTFDHGGEVSARIFVNPKKPMPYVRGSRCAEQ